MFLIPGTTHVVRWTKQNLLDETTYYPYAIIRDTRSAIILNEFALSQIASGRFSKNWNVAQDPTGLGREIEVEITIYEDAARTQVSGVYGRWTDTYTIFNLPGMTANMGGGQIDYKYIEQLMRKVIKEIPPQDKVDLSGIESKLDGVGELLSGLMTDILQVGDKVDRAAQIEKTLTEMCKEVITALEKAPKDLDESVRKARETIGGAIKDSAARAIAVLDEREGQISAKTDEELTHIVEQFKTVIMSVAGSISDEIKQASEALRKPVSVKFDGIDTVGGGNPPVEKKKGSDPRADHVVSLME